MTKIEGSPWLNPGTFSTFRELEVEEEPVRQTEGRRHFEQSAVSWKPSE